MGEVEGKSYHGSHSAAATPGTQQVT